MAKPSTDKIERHYVEQFRKVCPLLDGRATYGDKPDVIVCGTRNIGIEITNFFVESGHLLASEQRQRPLRGRIAEEARKLYRVAGRTDIGLTIGFDARNPITPPRMRKLPGKLSGFATSIHNRASGKIERLLFQETMPEISSIWLHSKEETDAQWRLMQCHTVELTAKGKLEAVVRKKEAKANEYEQCDAYWLLIVVEPMDAAQEQEIRIDDPHVDSEVFEKIIIYKPLFEHIVVVK